MQVFPTPFDLTQPAGQILAVVFFFIPGLNATWMIERLAGRTTLSSGERLLRAIALSVLIYGIASPWLLRIGHLVARRAGIWPWEPIIGFSVLIFILPATLGLGWAKLREEDLIRGMLRRLTRIVTAPTSWDFVFARRGSYFVRLKLRDGERVGGLFGAGSNAGLYPETQDLYLQQAWRLDDDGSFIEPVPDSRGLLIRRENVELLELLVTETQEEAKNGKEGRPSREAEDPRNH